MHTGERKHSDVNLHTHASTILALLMLALVGENVNKRMIGYQ